MSNSTQAAPRPVWLPPAPESPDQPGKSERRPPGLLERTLFVVSAVVMGLVVVSAQSMHVGQYASLIVSSVAELPEHGSLLFFGSALIGLGIWVRRRPRRS